MSGRRNRFGDTSYRGRRGPLEREAREMRLGGGGGEGACILSTQRAGHRGPLVNAAGPEEVVASLVWFRSFSWLGAEIHLRPGCI